VRIADILFRYKVPGAVVVDLTDESAGLSAHAALAPGLGLPYQRGQADLRGDAELALVLHSLPPAGQEAAALDLDRAGMAARVAHIVFFDRVEAFLENGLIDLATRSGYELASTHVTEHKVYRYAAVLRRPDDETSTARLRLVNEYRFDKLLVSELEREQAQLSREREELRAKVTELRSGHQQLRNERQQLRSEYQQLRAELQQLRSEHKLLGAEFQQMTRARDEALGEVAAERKQVEAYKARLVATFQALERSRRSIGFRVGLATWAATSKSRANVFAMPRRWVRSFRGKDEVLEKLRELPKLAAGVRRESKLELAAIEKNVLFLGLEPSARPGPGVAGVVSPRFAEELSASTKFRALAPHGWRHQLEAELPAYVLVTADGLQPGAAWAGWGTPGGRDGSTLLRELIAWCRGIHVPIVYWDTVGTGRAPSGLRFDALFAVSRRRASAQEQAFELLLPAVEPLVWNPVAVAQSGPRNPIHVGAFDRRGDRAALAALEALLGAAAGRGLDILDVNGGLQGPLAGTVRFPAELDRLARRRPPAEAERIAIKSAGILVCGNRFSDSDFPSWELLRGLAMGVHVMATPAELDDEELARAVEQVADAAGASEALDRLAQRPLLDPTWRSGLDRLLAAYSLRDRLDRIAHRCGAPPVSAPQPSVAVIARLRSDSEARALREFLAAQTVAPVEVRVLVDELDDDGRLGEVVDPTRITSLRSTDPQGAEMLGDTSATHLICWSAGTPVVAEAVAELSLAASFTESVVLLLAPESGAGSVLYQYGAIRDGAVIAVRRDALVDHLARGAALEQAAASLAASETGCLVVAHPTVGAASQRSVA